MGVARTPHPELAAAYAVHILDVYAHYRWRCTLQKQGDQAWSELLTDDTRQDKYFKTDAASQEVHFWLGE